MLSSHATCEYSCIRPPSRSCLRTRVLSSAGATGILPSGGCWLRVRLRPVGVVVIDVFTEGVVEMSLSGDEDAVGALAPRTGDPPLADRVRARRPDGRGDDPR